MTKRLVAFPYYGGKNSHLNWLLPLLPEGPSVKHYCEPFGGSAAVLLNRKPAPVETYNDLDGNLVNFFKVLRDHPEELIRKLKLTPYSREEFAVAAKAHANGTWKGMERARQFYVLLRQSMGGGSGFSVCDWARLINPATGNHCPSGWQNGVETLYGVAQRMATWQIENKDAVEVLAAYDSKATVFYCDPPYDPAVCSPDYKHKFSAEQYKAFCAAAEKCKGKVAISGYNSPMLAK